MTPTPKLRFVARINGTQIVKVLQQWWVPNGSTANEIRFELNGEWRDVPLEKEA